MNIAVSPRLVETIQTETIPLDTSKGIVAASPLRLDPVPHVYIENVLSDEICQEVVQRWPDPALLFDEGGLNRKFKELVTDNKTYASQLPAQDQPFWNAMLDGPLKTIICELAQKFAPYIAAKFVPPAPRRTLRKWLYRTTGYPEPITLPRPPVTLDTLLVHRLMCLQAQSDFVEHTPHRHDLAPAWIFTILIYIDDYGAADRGTTLYGTRKFKRRRDTIPHLIGNPPPLRRAFDAPFRRGSMLSFIDSMLSYHGSTPFQIVPGERVDGSRRIIRAHISLTDADAQKIYGRSEMAAMSFNLQQSIEVYKRTKNKALFDWMKPGFDRDIEIAEHIGRRQIPNVPRLKFEPPQFKIFWH